MKIITWPPSPTQKLAAVAIGVFLVVIFGWMWISAGHREAANLATADAQKKASEELTAKNKELELARDKAEAEAKIEREASAKLVQANLDLVGTIRTTQAAREREASARQAAILGPKPIDEVVEEARKILGIEPKIQADGTANIEQTALQNCIALKDRMDSMELRQAEDKRQIRLLEDTTQRQQKTIESLEKSGAAKDQTIAEGKELQAAQKQVIASYEKVARKGFWRKAGDVSWKVGLSFGAALLAAKVAQ